jgi:hypothetical protein
MLFFIPTSFVTAFPKKSPCNKCSSTGFVKCLHTRVAAKTNKGISDIHVTSQSCIGLVDLTLTLYIICMCLFFSKHPVLKHTALLIQQVFWGFLLNSRVELSAQPTIYKKKIWLRCFRVCSNDYSS